MKVDYRLGDIEREICLLLDVSLRRNVKQGWQTRKEIVSDLREGSGDASIAVSKWGYREGMAISAARQRRVNGIFCSNSDL